MAFDIGDWGVGQPLSSATGALLRVRTIMESLMDQPPEAPDWVSEAGTGDFVKAIVQGIWEEVVANAEVSGIDENGDVLVEDSTAIT